jgi:RimJ/RimL family protein N-acetyltransferase
MRLLRVRRLEYEDLPVRVEWFNTPSVYSQMSVEAPLSLADTRQWFAENALNEHRRDFSFLLHDAESADRLVAMGGLVSIEYRHRRAELYIVVEPGMTGCGIGQKAVQWLCNFGFIQLSLFRIYLYTLADNDGARRLYERNGFVHEGILHKHVYHNGALVDRHIQALLRSDWEKQSWRIHGSLTLEVPA